MPRKQTNILRNIICLLMPLYKDFLIVGLFIIKMFFIQLQD